MVRQTGERIASVGACPKAYRIIALRSMSRVQSLITGTVRFQHGSRMFPRLSTCAFARAYPLRS